MWDVSLAFTLESAPVFEGKIFLAPESPLLLALRLVSAPRGIVCLLSLPQGLVDNGDGHVAVARRERATDALRWDDELENEWRKPLSEGCTRNGLSARFAATQTDIAAGALSEADTTAAAAGSEGGLREARLFDLAAACRLSKPRPAERAPARACGNMDPTRIYMEGRSAALLRMAAMRPLIGGPCARP